MTNQTNFIQKILKLKEQNKQIDRTLVRIAATTGAFFFITALPQAAKLIESTILSKISFSCLLITVILMLILVIRPHVDLKLELFPISEESAIMMGNVLVYAKNERSIASIYIPDELLHKQKLKLNDIIDMFSFDYEFYNRETVNKPEIMMSFLDEINELKEDPDSYAPITEKFANPMTKKYLSERAIADRL